MALVFLGVSLQEVGPKDQAPLAFKKAIRLDSTKILAWNGLLNYYEKNEFANKTELADVYLAVMKLEESQRKVTEYGEKLVDCCVDPLELCGKIHSVILDGDLKENVALTLWTTIANICSKQEKLPLQLTEIYCESLETLLGNTKSRSRNYYLEYLKILHKQGKLEDLLQKAEAFHETYTYDSAALEWICKIYNESKIEQTTLSQKIEEKISEYCKRLLDILPDSSMGIFTLALLKTRNMQFTEAAELLEKVVAVRPGLMHAWVLLTKCYLTLKLFDEALFAAAKADKLLRSINDSNVALRCSLDKLRLEILSRSDEKDNLSEAVEIGGKLTQEPVVLLHLIRACIGCDMLEEAERKLDELKATGKFEEESLIMYAKLLKKQGKLEEALRLLQDACACQSLEYFLMLGDLYWEQEMWEKSLIPYLKAAKVDPNYYLCFIRLGHYYQKTGDLERSKRCYEKAFKLNSKNSQIVLDLSNIYRQQKNWDQNTALLEHFISDEIKPENMWAYFQLGLSYLEQKEYEKAVGCLRIVARMNPTNSHCWESLADAYLARGAYTAALKCYQKTAELVPHSLYPLLQIATIRRFLGDYAEAREEYEQILKENRAYMPALKGLAETCIAQAKRYKREQMIGLGRDCAQYALDKLTEAPKQRADVSCIWKLLGDGCFFIAKLPEKYCHASVIKALAEGQDIEGKTVLNKNGLYTLAARCYCKSLSLVEQNVLLWHDLATCYFSHACESKEASRASELFDLALNTIRHCVHVNPDYWQHWNLLGNIYCKREPKNYMLAQHAFIKAVIAENNSAVAWCNLGTLYLILQDVKLANKAFAEAQRADPDYVNGWIGQALVAEKVVPQEAMDLFRHSTQLGVHEEGGIGYAHWVCKTLLETPSHKRIYAIHDMHAIPVACDALTWYTECNPKNPCAWNMLGILRERMGLKSSVTAAYANAYNDSKQDATRINYARALTNEQQYERAVQLFSEVEAATFCSGVGLALALYKSEEFEESYNAYESALHWLTDEQVAQSELLVALASMAYMVQGPDDARTLLFQSIALKPPSPWAFYATLSLALTHGDLKLAQLVLQELQSIKDQPECIPHYVTLLSYTYLLQEKYEAAVAEVSKMVHRHPDQPSVWLTLGCLLLRIHKQKMLSKAASNCIKTAMHLGKMKMDVTKVLCLMSLSSLLMGNDLEALRSAQKAVHCYPNVAESWIVLVAALSNRNTVCGNLKNVIGEFIMRNLKCSPVLTAWLEQLC